jgi:GTP-binding protein
MSKLVAIVGRPNVGKSTLFNRLLGERKAIVDDESGVTRDRHYGTAEWQNREFNVVDTGGYVPDSKDLFESAIRDQVMIAMEEADALLFVVDVASDLVGQDEDFARILRRTDKPVLLVVNKVDNHERLVQSSVFYALGYEKLHCISAITGSGTGDLLDDLMEQLGPDEEQIEDTDLPRISIIGRPNVGKSSLVNALLGKERNIVTDIPGTTRDTIHSHYNAYGKEMLLVDTAGVRKKGKVHENIEFYSVMRSIKAIESSDVCVLMIDATLGVETQDMNLFSLAHKNGKGIVILVNKWDLVENKDTHSTRDYTEAIKAKIAPFTDVPILFISALTKQRIHKALEEILQVYENLTTTISTSVLNDYILPVMQHTTPPAYKGKFIKIKYATQLKTNKVSFAFFCNLPQYIRDPYKRFIENKLREKFKFTGVPITIFFRKK